MNASIFRVKSSIARVGGLRHALFAAAVAAPWLCWFIAPEHLHGFVTAGELVALLGPLAFLTSSDLFKRVRCKMWAACFAAFAVGTTVYNLGVGQARYPRNYLGDAGFVVAMGLVALLLWQHMRSALRGRDIFLLVLFAAIHMALQASFVLIPLAHLAPDVPKPAIALCYTYSLFSAVVAPLAGMMSIRARRVEAHAVAQCLLFIATADFASRYTAVVTSVVSVCWMEAGWCSGLIGIGLLSSHATLAGRDLLPPQAPLAAWSSIRSLLGLVTFALLLGFVGIGIGLNLVTIRDAFDLTHLLFVMQLAWLAASSMGAQVSGRIRAVAKLMPRADAIRTEAEDPRAILIPRVETRRHLEELAQILNRYNDVSSHAMALMTALLKEHRDAAVGRQASQVAHDIKSPLAALSVARVNDILFQRVVSNLLNNAIESIAHAGTVELHVSQSDGTVTVSIRDAGGGMCKDTLDKLGQRGWTRGKAGGSGIGLAHAFEAVHSWGGRLHIDSKLGHGTRVDMIFPQSAA